MSMHAPHPRRVARIDLNTIGPLYHHTGCCCSRQAGSAVSDDLDPANPPDTPSQGAVMGPTVTRPPFTAAAGRPATCFARHPPRAGPLPRNMWGCATVIGLCPTLFASPSGVVGCRLTSRANHCLPTDCSVHRVDTKKRKISLFGCCICSLHNCDIMSQRQDSDTDGSSSSSGEWDGLPSPDVLRKYREPKWYMERGAQTEADWYTGPYRGLGVPHRPVHGRAAATALGAGARARRAYRPRRCGLCYQEHLFDTRTGLNNHSKQHGYYYSLKGDCFVPLGEAVSAVTPHHRPPPGVAASA